jgi:hypothetical protein
MTKMTLAFALALAAALPLSAEAQGNGKNKGRGNRDGTPPGQLCRAEGGTSNSRACRERYGDDNRRDDRDSDSDSDRDRRVRTSSRNGSVCIDRNRDGYCDNGTTAGRTNCADRDRDGVCDTRDSCVDRDRDGRCEGSSNNDGTWSIGDVIAGRTSDDRSPSGRYPTSGRYPNSLPLMSYAARFANGERPSAVRQWLGTYDVRVRYTDRDRDRRIESATWLNPAGTVMQVWQDLNEDGRADRVRVYERGRLVRTIQ